MSEIRYYADEMLDDIILIWAHNQALSQGGDGVTYVVSPRWKKLADRYASRLDRFPTEDADQDSRSFMDNQEGVVFCGEVPTYLLGQFSDAMVMLP